jgi:hypothetical protein
MSWLTLEIFSDISLKPCDISLMFLAKSVNVLETLSELAVTDKTIALILLKKAALACLTMGTIMHSPD